MVTLGVTSESIKIGSCSMESEKFITACETVNGAGQVAIVDLTAGNTVTKQRMSAEAAIMNPVSKVIALRGIIFLFLYYYLNIFLYFFNIAGQQLQIFNLDLRAKMKSHAMPVPVQYWRWITPNNIALVTAESVFHWSIEGMKK